MCLTVLREKLQINNSFEIFNQQIIIICLLFYFFIFHQSNNSISPANNYEKYYLKNINKIIHKLIMEYNITAPSKSIERSHHFKNTKKILIC